MDRSTLRENCVYRAANGRTRLIRGPRLLLITLGGLMPLCSGWMIVTRRLRSNEGSPLETLGVCRHALGLPVFAVAAEPVSGSYRAGRLRGNWKWTRPWAGGNYFG